MERISVNALIIIVVRGSSKAMPAAVFKTDEWGLDRKGGLNSTPAPRHAGGTPGASGRTRILDGTGTAGRSVRGRDGARKGCSRRLREARR